MFLCLYKIDFYMIKKYAIFTGWGFLYLYIQLIKSDQREKPNENLRPEYGLS